MIKLLSQILFGRTAHCTEGLLADIEVPTSNYLFSLYTFLIFNPYCINPEAVHQDLSHPLEEQLSGRMYVIKPKTY